MHQRHGSEILRQHELRLLESLLGSQERDRRRIGQELHDRLGSMLSAIKMQIAALEGKVGHMDDHYLERSQVVFQLLDDAVSEVRRIALDMTDGKPSRPGLGAALEDLRRTLHVPGELEVELSLYGLEAGVGRHTELVIYRITQELVCNVLEHAGADRLTIQITRGKAFVNVIVEDNGVGFDPLKVTAGTGLSSVRDRVAELGGVVNIDPGPGRGTTISIDLPLIG